MTAIQAMRGALRKIQRAQIECVNEHGFVKTECRYRYQMLTREAQKFQGAIDWMQKCKAGLI